MHRAREVTEYLDEVFAEVARQDALWGIQTWPDGTGSAEAKRQATNARNRVEKLTEDGELTYADILKEELWEAMAAKPNSQELIDELTQVAAICVSWIRLIRDR